MKRTPWFKFHPSDWLTDIELRSCSSAARGTLIDLMCIAHGNDPYGVILKDDTPEARKKLAKMLSLSGRTLDRHLSSLLHLTRISQQGDSSLTVKRMVSDHAYALQQSELGKRAHPKPSGSPPAQRREEKRREEKKGKAAGAACVLPFKENDFKEAWADWEQYRKEKRLTLTASTKKKQLVKLKNWGRIKSMLAIQTSIENGWAGLFEPDANRNKNGTRPKASSADSYLEEG
tara:strand:- start:1633 stop:2328 length:696 start_codon:yes stop_codon:yes gene_type:complete